MPDAVVVGAGPAGGQCARELAAFGYEVLLLERLPSLDANPFSTAGAPIGIMEQFDLPWDLVGSKWHTLRFLTDQQERAWHSPTPGGVVFDFARLRHFLAQGIELRLATPYQSHQVTSEGVEVVAGDETIKTRLLIDATGSERRVLGSNKSRPSIEATGIEQLVEVDEECYKRWSDALNLFMGPSIPQGYGWIFPMEPRRLKVGIGRYFPKEGRSSYRAQLTALLKRATQGGTWNLLEQHGKTLLYTKRRRDLHLDGPVIAIGDAVSTANPLAFEGIRHAMASGRIAAGCIDRYLKGDARALRRFKPTLRRYCGWTWRLTEKLTERIYRLEEIDPLLNTLTQLSYQELYNLCFHYRLRPALKLLLHRGR